ncbi:ONEC2 protein, partial [Eulacestoma nigropectus]|nr:ONEC2 protein [Eulacestoma nigropectus]
AMVPSMASLLDGAAEYRPELSIPLHHAMSVPCEASPPGMGMSGTYTTLTPLQPLPPISAVSDKFHHPHAHPHAHHHHHHHPRLVPAVGQSLSPLGNGLGPLPGAQQGLHGYGPPGHDKMLSPNFEAHAAMLARGEQHLPRGLGTPPAMLPPLNGAHHPAPPGVRREGLSECSQKDPELCCARRFRWYPEARVRDHVLSPLDSSGNPRVPCARSVLAQPVTLAPTVCHCLPSRWLTGSVGTTLTLSLCLCHPFPACKRKEQEPNKERNNSQKKSRLVFTDLQRRTLFAIFKENKRPSKEMQITISQQLGLELTTVSNFFMNARRRSLEKWQDDLSSGGSSSAPSTCTKA